MKFIDTMTREELQLLLKLLAWLERCELVWIMQEKRAQELLGRLH
jgi:hypothetical protein